ncbi:gasdermin-A isoform X1 [Cygnus atratus]|uniref:gasdermin-A isoform X1 n=1 Tax=Cygnus atratus TaxID=8868 RepID=UPI0015D5C5D0|nr:gasdermin-A isoform X1 [Cygnus atratus]
MAADRRMTGQQKSFRARTLHLQLFADFALKISLVLPEPARKQAGSSCLAPLLTDACITPAAQTHAPAFPTACENLSSRSRMFKKVTQYVAKQMDPNGELVPVESIVDQDHFRTLCLVRRKRKTAFRQFPSYKRTEYKLHDVLLPGKDDKSDESLLCGDQQDSMQYATAGSACDKVDGAVSLPIEPVLVELGGSASSSKTWSIKMEKRHVPAPQLEVLNKERKVNTNHPFIQQLRKMQQNLYVVHETIEASEEVGYEESTKATGKIMAQLYAKFFAKVWFLSSSGVSPSWPPALPFRPVTDFFFILFFLTNQATSMRKQSITIPKGCILAFRVIQVTIEDAEWGIHYIPENNTSTFVSDGITQGQFGVLQKEVKQNCQAFSQLPADLRGTFLEAIKAVLRDKDIFQELAQKMEAVYYETNICELTTQSPKLKDVLSSLQSLSRNKLHSLAEAIYYTLDALSEQTEEQRLVLLESLEKEAVRHQRNLVERFFKCKTEDTEVRSGGDDILLPFLADGEDKTTIAMLEMSGVRIQENELAICDQEGFLALEALYASLYSLDLLSNSE